MSTSSPEATAKPSSPTLTKSALKSAKPVKIVTLKLSSYRLVQFPYEDIEPEPAVPPTKMKTSRSRPSDVSKLEPPSTADGEAKANSNTKAAVNGESETTSKDSKRKGIPGPKPGSKRSGPTVEPDGTPKPRGRPGPKKRKM